MSVIVTGASGFVGRNLCPELVRRGHDVVPVSRTAGVSVGEIDADTEWSHVLQPGATVVHLAARAHVLDHAAASDWAAFRSVNLDGTRRLAEQAAEARVKRLIFMSSVRVLGTHTNGRPPFSASDLPAPAEAYAVSKHEAELALADVADRTGLEICILRPPLVYGPGAAGNVARLLRLVRRGIPLPLGAIDNARSLIGVDNLVDLIATCISHPAAAGRTFLAADGVAVSTPELIRAIARAAGVRARLVPVPVGLLRFGGRLTGRRAEVDRLVGSLEVDASETRAALDWTPPISMADGLRRMVA